MLRERSDRRARIGVPNPNRVVPAAAGKMGAVRRIRHGIDPARMPNERSFQRGRIDDRINLGGYVVPRGVGRDAHCNGSFACRLNGRGVGGAAAGELRYGAVRYVNVRCLKACNRVAECDGHIKCARNAVAWTGYRCCRERIDDGINLGGYVVPRGVGGDAHCNSSFACRLNGRCVEEAAAGKLRYGAVRYVDVRCLKACNRFAEYDRHIKRARNAVAWTGNRRRNRRKRSGYQPPDPNRVVAAGAGKPRTVRRIRHGRDRTRMPRERSDRRAGPGVPDTNRVVAAAADKFGAVRRIRHRKDAFRMPCERSDRRAGPGVPDPNRVVAAAAGKMRAVRRIRHGKDSIRMSRERYARRPSPDVPAKYDVVAAAAGRLKDIRRICH